MAHFEVRYMVNQALVSKEEYLELVAGQSIEYLDILTNHFGKLTSERKKSHVLTFLDAGGVHFDPIV
jgi:hypothetical protein